MTAQVPDIPVRQALPDVKDDVQPEQPRESLSTLFRKLIDDIVNMVRSELWLARTEVGAKVSQATGSVAAIAVGGMFALVATSCLLVALIAWLAQRIGLVAATLSVAGVLALLAAILISGGILKLQRLDLVPRRAAANVKRDIDTLQGD